VVSREQVYLRSADKIAVKEAAAKMASMETAAQAKAKTQTSLPICPGLRVWSIQERYLVRSPGGVLGC